MKVKLLHASLFLICISSSSAGAICDGLPRKILAEVEPMHCAAVTFGLPVEIASSLGPFDERVKLQGTLLQARVERSAFAVPPTVDITQASSDTFDWENPWTNPWPAGEIVSIFYAGSATEICPAIASKKRPMRFGHDNGPCCDGGEMDGLCMLPPGILLGNLTAPLDQWKPYALKSKKVTANAPPPK